VVLIPNPDVDLDLPSDFCVDETIDLNDYLFHNGAIADTLNTGVWTIYAGNDTTATYDGSDLNVMGPGIISNVDSTGLFTICYTETEIYVCPVTLEESVCISEDCEVVNIYDIDAELVDKLVALCLMVLIYVMIRHKWMMPQL